MRYQRGLSLVGFEEILHSVQNDSVYSVIVSVRKGFVLRHSTPAQYQEFSSLFAGYKNVTHDVKQAVAISAGI